MNIRRNLLPLLLCGLVLLTGCSRDNKTSASESMTLPAVEFLMFPNPHVSLGVANYDVRITNNTATGFNYTLVVVGTDGSTQTFTGSLVGGIGANTTVTFEQNTAGGASLALNSAGINATIAVRVNGDDSDIASATGANPSVDLPRFQIDTAAYSNAYYAAIDPSNGRDTLAKFKTINGFGTTCAPNGAAEFEIRFRDVLDLGYGRHMCARGSTAAAGNIAVWVENFQVTAAPGVKYGPLNLEAVVNDDRRWHIGTNAIEFAPANPLVAFNATTNPRIVKFYTFNPDGTRRVLVDLDGRGAKAMPVPCISCHGGHALPLTAAGLFPGIRSSPRGETFARMQPINVDTLDLSPDAPYRRVDQEASFKSINQLVLCTYPFTGSVTGDTTQGPCRPAAANNEWEGTAAAMIKNWYGGDTLPNPTQSDTFVPTKWQDGQTDDSVFPNVAVPTGATSLYQNVIARNCRVCHLLRGNQNESAINFKSYGRFADPDITHNDFPASIGSNANSYNTRIRHHVFDKGNMPLALLKYEAFWESAAPAALAAWITGATSGGEVLKPTRPVAKPGPNRTIVTNVPHRLSAAESVNATSYSWRVTSANAANATLTGANTSRPTFRSTVNGVYTVELIVSNGSARSNPATLTIGTITTLDDGTGTVTTSDPRTIRFANIRSILQSGAPYSCTACHTNTDPGGPPVYYTDYDRDGDSDVDADDLHQFYLDIRARIDFTNIESSRILFRPSGHHHPGNLITNFDTSVTPGSAGRGAYDIFLNWILIGAPE